MNRFLGLGLIVAATAVVATWGPLKQGFERGWPQQVARVQAPAAVPHKCVAADGRVLYTTEPCAAGQRRQAASGGSVTVLSLPKPAAAEDAASQAPGAHPLKRLAGPTDPKMKEKALDRIIDSPQ